MTAPYYTEAGVTLYHGDALEVLAELHHGATSAIITDPPYGVLDVAWDVPVPWEPLAVPLLHAGGFVASFGLLRTLAPVCVALEASGLKLEAELVWHRGTLGTAGDRFGRSHELIAVHYNPPRRPPRIDRVRVPYAPASKPSRNHRRHELGAAPGSVWYVHETSGSYASHEHETAKPLPLITRLVAALTDPGELVLDPFVGSGTTARAAKDLGRRFIGIDSREECCEWTAAALSQESLDLGV